MKIGGREGHAGENSGKAMGRADLQREDGEWLLNLDGHLIDAEQEEREEDDARTGGKAFVVRGQTTESCWHPSLGRSAILPGSNATLCVVLGSKIHKDTAVDQQLVACFWPGQNLGWETSNQKNLEIIKLWVGVGGGKGGPPLLVSGGHSVKKGRWFNTFQHRIALSLERLIPGVKTNRLWREGTPIHIPIWLPLDTAVSTRSCNRAGRSPTTATGAEKSTTPREERGKLLEFMLFCKLLTCKKIAGMSKLGL